MHTGREVVYNEIRQAFGIVPEWVEGVPDSALTGFWRLMADFYLAETLIPGKYKDLIGLAVSGATRCRYCTLFHTEGAKLHGATDAEIHEANMMGGVTMLSSTFINAEMVDYDRFAKETRKIVEYARKQMAQQVRTEHPRA